MHDSGMPSGMQGQERETSDYYKAVSQADADLKEAMGHVRAREDAHELAVREAADERIRLFEHHLAECQRLRREYLGSNSH